VDDGGDAYDWDIENFTADDALITQLTTQQDAAGWACQHALSPASNITVEVWACSYSPADEAETIVTDIIANAAKK
jgi:hypothetical protein